MAFLMLRAGQRQELALYENEKLAYGYADIFTLYHATLRRILYAPTLQGDS